MGKKYEKSLFCRFVVTLLKILRNKKEYDRIFKEKIVKGNLN